MVNKMLSAIIISVNARRSIDLYSFDLTAYLSDSELYADVPIP
jgi:hypothetical protein